MNVWLQRHDPSADEHSEVSLDHGLELLEGFGWASELAEYERALEAGRERCPPGRGFVDGTRILHVMPIHDGRSHYHYSSDHPVRLFSFFGANKTLDVWDVPDRHRPELIGLHYDQEQSKLVQRLLELGKRNPHL